MLSCSPHPRGDGPNALTRHLEEMKFSPPAWGWSEQTRPFRCADSVLPTRVGMVRPTRIAWRLQDCSPHPRGDGPTFRIRFTSRRAFSPPAWGWSERGRLLPVAGKVLPTRVGMVRTGGPRTCERGCSPHPRGDGPFTVSYILFRLLFSPPAWGWSGRMRHAVCPGIEIRSRMRGLRSVLPPGRR